MLNFETLPYLNTGFLKNCKSLVKVRLFLYISAFIHIITVSCVLLSIDFSQYDDPDIQVYQKTRFKLLTAWFNLITLAYFPICLYCDWRELRGEHTVTHVRLLNHARNLCFTSILLPITTFGDMLFWRVWSLRRELIAPDSIHNVVPFWSQHSMHTVSLVVVLLDLILVRRERPKSNLPNIILLCSFLFAYAVVCGEDYANGIYIYPIFGILSGYKMILLVAYAFVESFFYYTSQWLIVDMVWGQTNKKIV